MLINKLVNYFSVLAKLGKRKHIIFPAFAVNTVVCILSEIFTYYVAKDPMIVGDYIILFNFLLIVYFSFRDGFKGGYTSIIVTISYYLYIITTRHYHGALLTSGIATTVML